MFIQTPQWNLSKSLLCHCLCFHTETKRSSKQPEFQVSGVTEEQTEGQQLMTHETVQMKDLNKGRGERKTANVSKQTRNRFHIWSFPLNICFQSPTCSLSVSIALWFQVTSTTNLSRTGWRGLETRMISLDSFPDKTKVASNIYCPIIYLQYYMRGCIFISTLKTWKSQILYWFFVA